MAPRAEAKKKPASDVYAIVSGTVFDERGYALSDADVTLSSGSTPDPSKEDQSKAKMKPMEAVSTVRGEFTFRVPPGPARYVVDVHAKGYQNQQKTIEIQDQERVEVTFQMDRQSK